MSFCLSDFISEVQNGFASGERDAEGVTQLRMNNVNTRGIISFDESIRVPCTENQLRKFRLFKGDVLFNNTNSTELVGKSALFTGYTEPVVFSNHFTRLRVHPDRADAAFVAFFLNHLWNRKHFAEICQRWIGQSAVKFDKIASLQVQFPDLPTQRRIAARLTARFATVEQARLAAAALAEVPHLFEKTLAREFQGITPLSLGIDHAPAPEGWQWHKLTDLARLESGHTPSRFHPEYWENGDIPWLALPDIRALDCRVATTTSEKTNALGIANSSARILPAQTVALSRTASVGFVTQFGRPMATSQDFVNWVCGSGIHPVFLMWLLRSSRAFIHSVSTGAIHKTVYMNMVERFHVCLPTLAVQKNIASRLDEMLATTDELTNSLSAQLAAIRELPAAYLRETFGPLNP